MSLLSLYHCGLFCTTLEYRLLPHLNPDWFYLSGTGLPRLFWKRGRLTGIVVAAEAVVVEYQGSQKLVKIPLPFFLVHAYKLLVN